MTKLSQQPLDPNPFITYRDPQTGKWVVEKQNPAKKAGHTSSAAQLPTLVEQTA